MPEAPDWFFGFFVGAFVSAGSVFFVMQKHIAAAMFANAMRAEFRRALHALQIAEANYRRSFNHSGCDHPETERAFIKLTLIANSARRLLMMGD